MPSVFTFYEDPSTPTTGTQINGGNPVAMGQVEKGTISPVTTINLWNGKNDLAVSTAIAPKFFATNGSGDASLLFNGTAYNGFKSMLEARSCDAYNTAADRQSDWTPIRPTNLLSLGDMPANSMRTIELRLNVPIDAPNIPSVSFSLQASA